MAYYVRLDPNIIGRSEVTFCIACIHDTTGFNEQHLAFIFSAGLVFHPFGNHIHVTFIQFDGLVLELDLHLAFDDDENFIGIFVMMPDEISLNLDQFKLIIVHLGDDLWRPVVRKLRQFLLQIDLFHSIDLYVWKNHLRRLRRSLGLLLFAPLNDLR